MAQYHVPQYIDIEDKIFGPLTFKQFMYFVVEAMIVIGLWQVLTPQMTIVIAVPLTIFVLLLVFYRVNGRSFLWFLTALAHFLFTGKLFLWERRPEQHRLNIFSEEKAMEARMIEEGLTRYRRTDVSEARLQHLAKLLDTAGSIVGEDTELPANFDLGGDRLALGTSGDVPIEEEPKKPKWRKGLTSIPSTF